MITGNPESAVSLRPSVTCPHCWHDFAPEDTLWVSEHLDLLDDPRLGTGQARRFLPTRYTAEGNAIDPGGVTCQRVACPECHLVVPRTLFEMPPLFVSIMGTPSCGKSYYLAAMTWQLRQVMPKRFAMSFADADPTSNRMLNSYEEDLFLNPHPDRICKLRKTEEMGDLYDTVQYGEQVVTLPRPFVFTVRPLDQHANFRHGERVSRILCLYDNAGESFEPGKDTLANPVTRHLARSKILMFLFDPTQDPRFRQAVAGRTNDPQLTDCPVTSRQETVIHEVADRIRMNAGLSPNAKHAQPLIVLATKYDAWWPLLGRERLPNPWSKTSDQGYRVLNMSVINAVSNKLRQLLWEHSPEIVSGAEAFASNVIYLPVSATGVGPETDGETGSTGIRPKDIQPMWAEVPMLMALACYEQGLIAASTPERTEK